MEITRQQLLRGGAAALGAATLPAFAKPRGKESTKHPRAITMWEFSWLERRWDGGSYEDWDVALDGLIERGYDAIRIEAFPHFFLGDTTAERTMVPIWNQHDWGSPDLLKVRLLPSLFLFLEKCRARGIKVGLSSWLREDAENIRMKITSPEILATAWLRTIEAIRGAGLIDTILYVDLCNEWPLFLWAPFFSKDKGNDNWSEPASRAYMDKALALVRAENPLMPLFYSLANSRIEDYLDHDVSALDAFDQHIWMTQTNGNEFYAAVGYSYERFEPKGYQNMVKNAERLYRARPEYWRAGLIDRIDRMATVGRKLKTPLITTECWGPVDYKDWPGLDWGWVKELCALGTIHAAGTGQWLAIATSNFCGPQFTGMWRDVAWHRRLTDTIKRSAIAEPLRAGRLWARL